MSEGGRVARLGSCMHNAEFSVDVNEITHKLHGDVGWHPDRNAQDASLAKFKFMLAFENNLCDHYLTEKVWKAYGIGIVPVVMAGERALEALPADDSYINAADFETAGELREYMHMVANDEALCEYKGRYTLAFHLSR